LTKRTALPAKRIHKLTEGTALSAKNLHWLKEHLNQLKIGSSLLAKEIILAATGIFQMATYLHMCLIVLEKHGYHSYYTTENI
jgi:hypothetical protein